MKLPEKYLFYVGNAYPHKNLEKLLLAILSIKYELLGIKLILVGPDDYFYKKIKKEVKKMNLNDQVIFYGPATRKQLTGLYKKAVALIFPSLMEGFGLPGLEAMKNGCPVLCSNIPVFHEIYGETVIYFNPTDVNDIKNKIKKFCFHDLNHSIRDQLIKGGLDQANKYSWQKLAKETLDIYQSV